MAEEETAAPSSAAQNADPCTREELLALVRAIKFAKPDASMRGVHREISQELSETEGFSFLREVQLNDVKKVWKKAVAEATGSSQEGSAASAAAATASLPTGQKWKLYTVGDGSVRTLAEEYSRAAAEAVAAEEQSEEVDLSNYVHVFLNVPADRSGSRPHQALINFQDNNRSKGGKKKKKKPDTDDGIVKIQVAAASDGARFPLLLYNADRSCKTFIHPDDHEDDGYDKIRNWIITQGQGGALGAGGGTKAYFYSRRSGTDVISIDIRQLAPPQIW